MKRIAAIAGLLFIAGLALAAAVWDGSAVAGVAGDFPDDGFYGACNSFPRDTSVTVTNLENGKSITVMITRNVDNPGVFIALSPKAAAELGMRAGSATRIRAVALVVSQAESTLPPTRAGESADPDYNPKVYVEREKAAVAAAAAAPVAAVAAPVAASPAVGTRPSVAPSVAPPASEGAEVFAKTPEPRKQQMPEPSVVEPKYAAAATAAAPTPTPAASTPVPAAPAPAVVVAPPAAVPAAVPAAQPEKAKPSKANAVVAQKPEASPTFPASPRPLVVGTALPAPEAPAASAAGNPNQAPEVIGGESKPSPRKATAPRLVFIEPPLPTQASSAPAAAAKAPEKASVDALNRPSARKTPYGVALAEPKPEFAPDELPDAVLSRVIAPTKVVPTPVLAEAEAPKNLGDLRTRPEAIAFDRPSYSEAVEAALAEAFVLAPAEAYSLNQPSKVKGAGAVAELSEASLPGSPEAVFATRPGKSAGSGSNAELAEAALPGQPEAVAAARPGKSGAANGVAALDEAMLPGSPDAIADRKVAGQSGDLSELQVPDVPRPVEGIAAERPAGKAAVAAAGNLDEPGVSSPATTGMGPTAVVVIRKGPKASDTGDLSDPAVPTPSESLTAGKAKSVEPGQAIAELAEPDPNGKGTSAIGGEKPSKAAAPGTGELASPSVPSPSESIAAEHPAAVAGGAKTITLEPATPRPPASAIAAAAPAAAPATIPALVPAKPSQPAAVATVTSPSPAGSVQAPASVPVLKGLAKGSYYVQIGVYGTNDALSTAVAGFKSSHYPLAVEKLTTKKGSAAFRLFVGPLSRDESGLVLIKIRSLGYKDAYIRQGT